MIFFSNTARPMVAGAAIALCCLGIRSDGLPHYGSRLDHLPRITLWAWERRENLATLDTQRTMVAYLDRTVTIGPAVMSQPRRNPIVLPTTAKRIPVVRIEVAPGAVFDDATRASVVRQLLSAASEPGAEALQIDFDATRSQRGFYRQLLLDVRQQMPAQLPLSMTALASWCSWDSWLNGLPVDEAVPMMFRMEPDRQRAPRDLDEFKIREPLCRSSVGISTTEPWPENIHGKRIYIFADEGWRRVSMTELKRRLP